MPKVKAHIQKKIKNVNNRRGQLGRVMSYEKLESISRQTRLFEKSIVLNENHKNLGHHDPQEDESWLVDVLNNQDSLSNILVWKPGVDLMIRVPNGRGNSQATKKRKKSRENKLQKAAKKSRDIRIYMNKAPENGPQQKEKMMIR
jgi:hypothetical protein